MSEIGYTPEELRRVLELLGEAWNVFARLERQHPSDADEFYTAIHSAQHLIMTRFR